MKALHFGAGNIGRGFIGVVLTDADYEVVFADVVPALINELKSRKEFKVNIVGGVEPITRIIRIHDAVFSNTYDVLPQIVETDIITTAVGPRILERIAPTLARGISLRMEQRKESYLNIIACENAIRATSALREFVEKELTPEVLEWAKQHVGFVDSAVDRIVPPAKHEDPLEVTVEDFCEWVIDETQIKGSKMSSSERFQALKLKGVIPTGNLMAFVERKLMTVNTGHAVCAYVGAAFKHTQILDAIRDEKVRAVVLGAMRESGAVIVKRYDFDAAAHEKYINKIIGRFENEHLKDEIARVGRDPLRKLSREDRLIKPLLGCVEYGFPYTNLLLGTICALQYTNPEDPEAVRLKNLVASKGLETLLIELTGFNADRVKNMISPLGILTELTGFNVDALKDVIGTIGSQQKQGNPQKVPAPNNIQM